MDLLVNVIGFAGVLCLAVPALHANKYARLVARLAASKAPYKNPAVIAERGKVLVELRELQNAWTRWKANLLLAGVILAGASYLLGIAKALMPG
jgi:hypothetical protein